MGAINYKSGNQITLGMNAIDEDDEYIYQLVCLIFARIY